jgi:hypothetical protein
MKGKAMNNPNALTTAGMRGITGEIDLNDILFSRAKLLQALSPEVQDDGMQQGLIIDSLTKEVLPEIFTPCFYWAEWIRFNGRKKTDPGYSTQHGPGELIWRSRDPHDPRVQAEGRFGEDGGRPLATKFLNFFSFFPESQGSCVIGFSNTSFRAGKELLSMALRFGGDLFSRQYGLAAKLVENDMGKFYVLTVKSRGAATAEDQRAAEDLFTRWNPANIRVDETTEPRAVEEEEDPY